MLIEKYNSYNPNFKAKLKTPSVLEATTMRIFYNEGVTGFKEVIMALGDNPNKHPGALGYKYYAEKIGEKIVKKYPEIAKATEEIKSIIEQNPTIKKQDLAKQVQPIINRIGPTIDITL